MNRVRDFLQSGLRTQPRDGGFRATLSVAPEFPLFPDHFRGHPILPGICLVQAVLLAGAACRGAAELRLTCLKVAKFFSPAYPGQEIVIDAQTTQDAPDTVTIKAQLSTRDGRLAQITLTARATGATTR